MDALTAPSDRRQDLFVAANEVNEQHTTPVWAANPAKQVFY